MLKIIAVPILVVLYLLQMFPLIVRQVSHCMCIGLDNAFDGLAALVGWDTSFWPLPKASEEKLPWTT